MGGAEGTDSDLSRTSGRPDLLFLSALNCDQSDEIISRFALENRTMKHAHLLTTRTVRYGGSATERHMSADWPYDERLGAWTCGDEFLVKSSASDALVCGTKKADLETGEDQKAG